MRSRSSVELVLVVLDYPLCLVAVELLKFSRRVKLPNLIQDVSEALALALGLVIQVQLHRVQLLDFVPVYFLLPTEVHDAEGVDQPVDVGYLAAGLLLRNEAQGDGPILPALVSVQLCSGEDFQNSFFCVLGSR